MKTYLKTVFVGIASANLVACSKIAVHQPDVSSTSVLKVTPSNANIPFNSPVQFNAYLVKPDGRVRDVTDEVDWAVQPGSSAVTSGTASLIDGRLTPRAVGPINVNAKFANLSASAVAMITTLPTSLRIEPSVFSLARGVPKSFRALAMYDDGIERDVTAAASWTAVDPSIMVVDAANPGALRALAGGAADVKASLPGLEAIASGVVSSANPVSLSLTPKRGLLVKSVDSDVHTIAHYSDGSDFDVTSATHFIVDNQSTGAVDQASSPNKIRALDVGNFKLDATFEGLQASGQYSVLKSVPADLDLTGPNLIARGLRGSYRAIVNFADLSTQDVTYGVTWSADNTSAASIVDGFVVPVQLNALNIGSLNLSADGGLVAKTIPVSIGGPVLQSLAVSPSSFSVPAGLSRQLTAVGTYSDHTTSDLTNSVSWSTNSSSVAQVSSNGLVGSLVAGVARISASINGISDSSNAIVTAPVLQQIAVSFDPATVAAGRSSQAKAVGTYSDSSTRDLTSSVAWSSGSSAIAGVSASGLISTLSAGSATIAAGLDGVSGSSPFTVSAAELTGYAISLASSNVAKGLSSQATAIGSYSDGSTQDLTSTSSWSSSAASLASVNGSGLVNALQQGSANITGSYGGYSRSAPITVSAPVVNSVAVTFAAASIAKGLTGQATAIATYTDGTTANVTSAAGWLSVTPSIAAVNSSGLITGMAAGTSVIRATYAGVSGNNTITITAPVANSISITFNKYYTNVYAEMLVATITAAMSDGTTLDISNYGSAQGVGVSMTNNGCFQKYNGQPYFTAVGYEARIQCSSVVTVTYQGKTSNKPTISCF